VPEVLREVQEEAGGGGLLSDQLDLLRGAICTIVLHLHTAFPPSQVSTSDSILVSEFEGGGLVPLKARQNAVRQEKG